MYHNIPAELRVLPQWVGANSRKEPINPRTGQLASVDDPTSWATFDEACRLGQMSIGFVLTVNDPYTIIDLDDKPHAPLTPENKARHQRILAAFDTYTEKSVSGRGYHIVVKASTPNGTRRDSVELYSSGRYMVFTGDVINRAPIANYQPLINSLYSEMTTGTNAPIELEELDELITDADLVDMAMDAINGAKFNSLCKGELSDYPSQSEADLALLSILAFYTRSNEQVRRIFRMSALGKRDKAIKNDTYLNFALGKIRAKEVPPVEAHELIANLTSSLTAPSTVATHSPAPIMEKIATGSIPYPPGLVGEIADYFFANAIRPVKEIALAGALAMVAGIVGRSYNVSGTGLNQYLLLLAKTGTGKEGIMSGIETLLSHVRHQVPSADQFIGPAAFASGQALIRVLSSQPCFVSVLGEFGLTLQHISDKKAASAQIMLRRALLDLYTKSGWHQSLRSSVYSDSEKNTKIVQAPALSIVGESTPETFFDGLTTGHVAEGLIPRFCIIEYTGPRPPRNPNPNHPPSPELLDKLAQLITVAISTSSNNTCLPVQIDGKAGAVLDSFDTEADNQINSNQAQVAVQIWNRAHLKAMKLAALLATGVDAHAPVVTVDLAQWAVDLVRRDIAVISDRFAKGDVGTGSSKQIATAQLWLDKWFKASPEEMAKSYCGGIPAEKVKQWQTERAMPYVYLSRVLISQTAFTSDNRGATPAIKQTLATMVEMGYLVEVAKADAFSRWGYRGSMWIVINNPT